MRTTSQTWKNIVAKGEFNMESVARIYGATGSDTNGTSGSDSRGSYKEYATITAPIITRALLSGDAISVGNTISSQLNFTVMTTDTIPKSAMIVIRARVKNNNSVSEWLEFGTYWIDHRSKNDELTDIEAYDAMKKGNQGYSDNSQSLSWPKTIKVVVQRIAQQMSVSIDSRTTTEIINSSIGDLNIVLKPNDDEVLLDVLRHIGEVLGGNWTITDDNQLRFVTTVSPPDETYYIVDEAHNLIKTEQGDYLIHEGESQEHAEQTHPAGGGTCFVPVVLGGITTASKYTISKIIIALDSDHVYSYGDNTGYELIVSESNPYASDALAQLLYSRINGIEYAPFEITNAIYDPATELGDWIVAGAVYGVLYNDKRTLDVGFYADISAPGRDEMEDEYPYVSALSRMKYETHEEIKGLDNKTTAHFSTIEQSLLGITNRVGTVETTLNGDGTTTGLVSRVSTVEQTASNIQLSVESIEDDYVSKTTDSIRSLFAMDDTNITLSAGVDSHGNPTGTITFNAGTMIVNGNNFSVDATGHMECYGATINGELYTADNNAWVKLDNGSILFGVLPSTSAYGQIKTGVGLISGTSYVVSVESPHLSLWSDNIYVKQWDADIGGYVASKGITREFEFVYRVGYTTDGLAVSYGTLSVVNGIITGVAIS